MEDELFGTIYFFVELDCVTLKESFNKQLTERADKWISG